MTTINEPLQQVAYQYGSSNQSRKALQFTVETQTENNEIISICHLNEKVIALELSDIARKMFRLNRTLFDKINSTTKLLGGKLYREEITKVKQDKNRCGVQLLDKYEHRDVEIMALSFLENTLPRRQSILLKTNRRVDFDPNNLSIQDGTAPLDPQSLTMDDIKNSTMVCEIEEIQLFQSEGVKTYMLRDYMNDSTGLYQVSYRIEITAETGFKDYLNFILDKLKNSLNFLTSYLNSINLPTNYDPNSLEFKKPFRDSIFSQLGISEDLTSINLGESRLKNSEFGRAALDYYNASLLLRNDVDKSVYGQILKNLLPTTKTTPENINLTVKSFEKLYSTIKKQYRIFNKDAKSSYLSSKITSKKNVLKKFVSAKTEKINIEREVLGYNLFSEKQKGLNKFSTSTYRQRIGAEQAKYYPSMDASDETNFMTSPERSNFASTSNSLSFVTPANLVVGDKKITCSRGMNNIPVSDVSMFRVAKSARAVQVAMTNYPSPSPKAALSKNVMSDFNITVGPPKTPILERNVDEEIDPLVDSKLYVGESSFFVTNNLELIFENYKRLMEKEDSRILAIVSDVIPGTLLKQADSIRSAKDLKLSNKKSIIRQLVAKKSIDFNEIPPQIKSMMTNKFQNNPNIDPLENRESRAIIDETQKNVFLVRAHTGFEVDDDGFPNLNRPIMKDMADATLGQKPILAKAYNYEVPELGIVKDKFMPTIYNNLLYVRG